MSTGSLFTNEIQEIEQALEIAREMLQKKDQEYRERHETFGDHKLEQPILAADRFGYVDEVQMLQKMLRAFRRVKVNYVNDLCEGCVEIKARSIAASSRNVALQIRTRWNDNQGRLLSIVRDTDVDFSRRRNTAIQYMSEYHPSELISIST